MGVVDPFTGALAVELEAGFGAVLADAVAEPEDLCTVRLFLLEVFFAAGAEDEVEEAVPVVSGATASSSTPGSMNANE